MLRAAHKERLIINLELWLKFLKERNLTVHTYNEDIADEVYEAAKQLPSEIRSLLEKLK